MTLTRTNTFQNSAFTALLCVDSDELRQIITEQLTPLGFEIHAVTSAEEAGSQWYSHFYDVMVISETFGGGDAETHPVLAELAGVPLDFRRAIFVVLIGNLRTTRSEMEAFVYSVDLVVSMQDAPNLKALVGQGLTRQGELYADFHAISKRIQGEG